MNIPVTLYGHYLTTIVHSHGYTCYSIIAKVNFQELSMCHHMYHTQSKRYVWNTGDTISSVILETCHGPGHQFMFRVVDMIPTLQVMRFRQVNSFDFCGVCFGNSCKECHKCGQFYYFLRQNVHRSNLQRSDCSQSKYQQILTDGIILLKLLADFATTE